MGGYQGQRGWNPVGLGAAIAINGGVLALLLLATGTPQRIVEKFRTIDAINVPIEPPPPMDEPKPVERTIESPSPTPPLYLQRPPIASAEPPLASTDVMPTLPPPIGPVVESGTGTGSGGGGVTVMPPMPVMVDSTIDPRFRADFQPDYPPSERNLGRDGVVTVRVLVGGNGRVTAIEPVRSSSDAFFQATKRRALSKWRFRPATRDGVPIESWREMTVRFTMEDA